MLRYSFTLFIVRRAPDAVCAQCSRNDCKHKRGVGRVSELRWLCDHLHRYTSCAWFPKDSENTLPLINFQAYPSQPSRELPPHDFLNYTRRAKKSLHVSTPVLRLEKETWLTQVRLFSVPDVIYLHDPEAEFSARMPPAYTIEPGTTDKLPKFVHLLT